MERKSLATISGPKIGIALGGGAARGLTHIPFIEAMDELGLRPSIIAGTSIGALLGAGWAAGLTGSEIREFAYDYLGNMRTIVSRIWSSRSRTLGGLMRSGLSLQLDAIEVIQSFVPDHLPEQFSDLEIPFFVVATDFRTWHQVVFRSGLIVPAIAASSAIPSVFKPVQLDDRLLIDGSVVNPLPLDVAARDVDILIGVDVCGSPSDTDPDQSPSLIDATLGAAQIMMHGLAVHTLAAYPPDIYVRPHVKPFGAMEFWRVKEIVQSGDKDKERFKRELARAVEAFIVGQQKNL